MPTLKHVAIFSALTSGLILAALPAIGGPGNPTEPSQAPARQAAKKRAKPSPEWVLPQAKAREEAKKRRVPLLIVSLNGNLDGYC